VTAFVTGLVAWLRTRRGEVSIKVTLPDGTSLELTAKRVAGLDSTALQQQVTDVAALLKQHQRNADEPEPRALP